MQQKKRIFQLPWKQNIVNRHLLKLLLQEEYLVTSKLFVV